ncbi:MAG: hypothetical protein QOK42_1593 [Frankiaceae bacterium]|nr:hypothetical protein [Frankiaceae bacterium]
MSEVAAVTAEVRLQGLLRAVIAVGRELDLPTVLRRVVEVGVELVDAQYGALGVIGEEGRLTQFINVGLDPSTARLIGDLPEGHGLLGQLVRHPRPLRLHDLGEHESSFGFPAHHPPMSTFLGVPIRIRGEVFGNLYLTEKRGGLDFTQEDEAVVEALAVAAGVGIDNARLFAAAQRREQAMRAGAAVTTALISGDSPRALRIVAELTRDVMDAELAAAWTSTPGGWVAAGTPGDLPEGWDELGADVAARVGHGPGRLLTAADADLLGIADLRVGAAIALGSGPGRVVVLVGRRTDGPMPAELPEPLTAFISQVSVAVELAQRRRDAEDLAVLEDRDRIARDLHDHVIQRLFAVGMSLESTGRFELPEGAAERVRRCVTDLDDTIRDIRTTIFELQSHDGETGLRARALVLMRAAERTMSARAVLHFDGAVDFGVSEDVADHALAVLREALSNVARHAAAGNVQVLMRVAEGELALRIADDGSGITTDFHGGSGTSNMRSRADQLGGRLSIGPGAEGGTLVEWVVPLEQIRPATRA